MGRPRRIDGKRPPLALRPVRPKDEPFLFRLFCSSRALEMSMIDWDPERKERFLKQQYRAQKTEYASAHPRSRHQIVVADGGRAGRLWVSYRDDELRILDLALLSATRGRGFEERLVAHVQRQAAEQGRPVRCCAVKHEPWHERLLLETGFTPVEETDLRTLMEWRPSMAQARAGGGVGP